MVQWPLQTIGLSLKTDWQPLEMIEHPSKQSGSFSKWLSNLSKWLSNLSKRSGGLLKWLDGLSKLSGGVFL